MKNQQDKTPQNIERTKNALMPLSARCEMNLAQLPIAVPARSTDRSVITLQGKPIRLEDGSEITPKWSVSADAVEGLPTEFEERELVALVTIARQQGFGSQEMHSSYYQLLQVMGLTRGGHHYQRLKKGLRRLNGVTLWGDFIFWEASRKETLRLERAFGLFDDLILASKKTPQGERGIGFKLKWSAPFWNNFLSGYLMGVDRKLYFKCLERPLARRLYLVIKQAWYGKDEYTFDVLDLAAACGMKQYRYPAWTIKALRRGLDELTERWEALDSYRVWRNKQGFWRLTAYQCRELPTLVQTGGKMKTQLGMLSPQEVWECALGELEGQMTKPTFDTWLSAATLIAVDEDAIVIGVRSECEKAWLENRLSSTIERTVASLLDKDIDIRFQVKQ